MSIHSPDRGRLQSQTKVVEAGRRILLPANACLCTPAGVRLAAEVGRPAPRDGGQALRLTLVETEMGLRARVMPTATFLVLTGTGIVRRDARAIRVGDHLLAPFGRNWHGTDTCLRVAQFHAVTSAKQSLLVDNLDELTARALGYIVSEGYKAKSGASRVVSVSQNMSASDVVSDMKDCLTHSFGNAVKQTFRDGVAHFRMSRKDIYRWLTEQGVGDGSARMATPLVVRSAPLDLKCQFLRAFYEGDGSVWSEGRSTCVKFASKSDLLVRQIQHELLNLGIAAFAGGESKGKFGWFSNLQLASARHVEAFDRNIGFVSARKQGVVRVQPGYDRSCVFRDIPRAELEWFADHLHGREREKLRECFRTNTTVRFGDTRWPLVERFACPERTPTYWALRNASLVSVRVERLGIAKGVPLVELDKAESTFRTVDGLVLKP